jgi:DNA-binding MarR family transcriptional regulator
MAEPMPMRPANESTPATTTTASMRPAWHRIPVAAARRFHQICAAKSTEALGDSGLTPLQYGAVLHLNRKTGSPGIEQNALAARLNIDRNTASVLVEQLVKAGVVERQVNGADRRARLLSLTRRGEQLYGDLSPALSLANSRILSPLTPRERKQFMNLLIRVIEGNLHPRARAQRGMSRAVENGNTPDGRSR